MSSEHLVPFLPLAFALSVLLLLSGCDSKTQGLASVSGVVTLDGSPIPSTIVNFQPVAKDGKSPGPGSVGRCDDTGRYVLRTIRDEPGAVVGNHRVRIYSFSPESPVAQDEGTVIRQEQFPARYNYGSELFFEVEPGGTDTADFKLTSSEK